jgi:hypothetical protein
VEAILDTPIHINNADIRAGALLLGDDQIRYLIDSYYSFQDARKAFANRCRAAINDEPTSLQAIYYNQMIRIETNIKPALQVYAENNPLGRWAMSNHGIGPVIAAGLLAHIHIGYWCHGCRALTEEECHRRQTRKKFPAKPHEFRLVDSTPTVGHIWSFAGLAGEHQTKWEKGTKRPWNASLKVLLCKAGSSFFRGHGSEKCFYGHKYVERKAHYSRKNERGDYAMDAARYLKEKNYKKDTEAYKAYIQGKLPPGQIDNRARRAAVKLFIAHYHDAAYRLLLGRIPPAPYAIEILGHEHYVPPPIKILDKVPQAAE